MVGTGIRSGLQTTPEAREVIEQADKVLYLLPDAIAEGWIQGLNPSAESLARFYEPGKPRAETYAEIVEEVFAWVHKGLDICFALYGHPGVFAEPGHVAIRRATDEGVRARMLPGLSAEDCLFADLGVDPGDGCQSYEATDFLVHPPSFDPRVTLILWQMGAVGPRVGRDQTAREGLAVLAERLIDSYGPDHEVVVYEAATYPVGGPRLSRVRLGNLAGAEVRPMATLYVPASGSRPPDPTMLDRLGMAQAGG